MNVGRSVLPNRFGLFAVFIACLPSTALAQEQPRTVTGIVVDAANQPVSGVLVFVDDEATDGAAGSTTTGSVGAFRLEVLTPGTHRLNFRKEGFAPRALRLSLTESDGDRRDIGVVSLDVGADPTANLTGRVVEGVNGNPIDGAVVELNGNVVAVSGDDGRFRVSGVPIAWGSNQILVGRLSYVNETGELWIADPNETFDLSVTLHPLPIEIAGVVAEVARPPGTPVKMEPFYQRRQEGFGDFFTRLEIEERNPSQFTDLMRYVPGVRLIQRGAFSTTIRFSRAMTAFRVCASPMIYYDGILRGGADDYVDLDRLVNTHDLAGVELYSGASRVPPEFNTTGSACGVIVIWTR